MTDVQVKPDVFDKDHSTVLRHEKWLADEIKKLEAISDPRLPANSPYVIRIDGVSFRTYTRGFAKPFDQRMTRAFIRTSADLLQRFNPTLVFYASDEISLVFDACPIPTDREEKHAREHMYSGRIQKLASVCASFAAAKFNKYINEEDWSDLAPTHHVRQRVSNHSAFFDGRAFSVPNTLAALAAIYWRHRYDTRKNAILTYARNYYSQKALQNKNTLELRELMREEHQWDVFRDAPKNIIYGTFLKKELYDLPAMDQKTQQSVIVKRSRIRIGSFDLDEVLPKTDDQIQFVLGRYWNDCSNELINLEVPDWWLPFYRPSETSTVDADEDVALH